VSQEEIVNRIKHILINMPGRGDEITKALSSEWKDSNGKRFKSKCTVFDPTGNKWELTTKKMLRELENEKIVVHGAAGHATLLTAVVYEQYPNGAVRPIKGTVRDPSPYYRGARRELQPTEFASIYAAVISVEAFDDVVVSSAKEPKDESSEITFESALKDLWEASLSDFRSCRGKFLRTSAGDGHYESKIRVPGAETTEIVRSDVKWECHITFSPYDSFNAAKAEAKVFTEKAIKALELKNSPFVNESASGSSRFKSESIREGKNKREFTVSASEMSLVRTMHRSIDIKIGKYGD
jgi:hypothetical protein